MCRRKPTYPSHPRTMWNNVRWRICVEEIDWIVQTMGGNYHLSFLIISGWVMNHTQTVVGGAKYKAACPLFMFKYKMRQQRLIIIYFRIENRAQRWGQRYRKDEDDDGDSDHRDTSWENEQSKSGGCECLNSKQYQVNYSMQIAFNLWLPLDPVHSPGIHHVAALDGGGASSVCLTVASFTNLRPGNLDKWKTLQYYYYSFLSLCSSPALVV